MFKPQGSPCCMIKTANIWMESIQEFSLEAGGNEHCLTVRWRQKKAEGRVLFDVN